MNIPISIYIYIYEYRWYRLCASPQCTFATLSCMCFERPIVYLFSISIGLGCPRGWNFISFDINVFAALNPTSCVLA